MASSVSRAETYPFTSPITPPTPCSSPTLQDASLQTSFTHNLPKDDDPELQSLIWSYYDALSLARRSKAMLDHTPMSSNTERIPYTTPGYFQVPNGANHRERGQQSFSPLVVHLGRDRTVRNDVYAWWKDTNVIGSNAQGLSSASTLVGLVQMKNITDDFRTDCNLLDTYIGIDCSTPRSAPSGLSQNSRVVGVTFTGPGIFYVLETMRFNGGPSCYALVAKI